MPRGGAARSARVAHNHKVAGSNPAPATKKKDSLRTVFFLGFGADRFCDFLPRAKIVAGSRTVQSVI